MQDAEPRRAVGREPSFRAEGVPPPASAVLGFWRRSRNRSLWLRRHR